MKTLLLVPCLALLTGCLMVPSTQISGDLRSGKFNYKSPKDAEIGYLKIIAATNGAVTVELRKVSGTNNPDVIANSAMGQANIINAVGNVANAAFATGIKAASKTVIP